MSVRSVCLAIRALELRPRKTIRTRKQREVLGASLGCRCCSTHVAQTKRTFSGPILTPNCPSADQISKQGMDSKVIRYYDQTVGARFDTELTSALLRSVVEWQDGKCRQRVSLWWSLSRKILLGLVSGLACAIRARRASKVDPIIALSCDSRAIQTAQEVSMSIRGISTCEVQDRWLARAFAALVPDCESVFPPATPS